MIYLCFFNDLFNDFFMIWIIFNDFLLFFSENSRKQGFF